MITASPSRTDFAMEIDIRSHPQQQITHVTQILKIGKMHLHCKIVTRLADISTLITKIDTSNEKPARHQMAKQATLQQPL